MKILKLSRQINRKTNAERCFLIVGSGYSVEGQITGKENFGGLQIEVIPSYRRGLKVWGHAIKPGEPEQVDFEHLDEYKTPARLGLKPFDKLRAYSDLQVPLKISDLAHQISSDKIRLSDFNPLFDGNLIINPLRAQFPSFAPTTQSVSWGCNEFVSDTYVDVEADDHFTTSGKSPSRSNNNSEIIVGRRVNAIENLAAVKTRDLRAMGLAAGGKMIQDIVRDNNAAEIWDVQNATLMNVHILDPASCEQVTHIVQEPPMDAQAYIDADLPFYVVEENVENRLDNGEFGQVVSVSEMDQNIGITTEPSFDPNKPKMCEECSLRLCDCM